MRLLRCRASGRGPIGRQDTDHNAADWPPACSLCLSTLPSLQLDGIGQAQQCLAALPASLQALADQAGQQAAALQRQHGFTLNGLEQLLQGQAGSSQAAPAGAIRIAGCALTGSLLLSTPAALCSSSAVEQQERQRQRQEYASSVLARFEDKLTGRLPAPASTARTGRGGGSGASVAAQVEQLIAAAVSEASLARMYEGWMPWV